MGDFVPDEPEPAQIGFDGFGKGCRGALAIGVIEAKKEPPAVAPRMQPVCQRDISIADMQPTGGTGREADSRRHVSCGSRW